MSDVVLETRNLRKSFGALVANEDVSLRLKTGEIHAVIGPNGAGKSTLISMICGSLQADAGQVLLQGKDATGLSTQDRAKAGMARTFQVSALAAEDTVLENVLLGSLGAQGSTWRFWTPVMQDRTLREKAEYALDRVGLIDFANARCSELSHGQRRQLEVAVALTLQPKVFIMDEPMAGLGADGSKTMTGFLDELRHEAPLLLVEHDMDAVFALANRITVLVYGRVIATGAPHEIRANRNVQQAYLGEVT